MKKYICILLCLCIAASLFACSKKPAPQPETTAATKSQPNEELTETTTPSDDGKSTYTAHISAISLPLANETKYAEDKSVLFSYYYPTISVVLPDQDVASIIELDLMNKIDSTRTSADKIYQAAVKAYSGPDNWYPYFYRISYQVMRLDQTVMSLYGNESFYDGNLRGSSSDICRNYELTTGQVLALNDIMYADYSADALCELIIEGLSEYDENQLFFDYKETIRDKFSTNVPVDSWYFNDDGLCFFFAPYEIASFAMGTITANIPYDKLSGLMKADYFPEEKLLYTGSLEIQDITDVTEPDLEKYSQFGELEVQPNSNKFLLHTNGSILNLRVFLVDASLQSGDNTSPTMIYASAGMGPQDALILDIPEAMLERIIVSYQTDGEVVTRNTEKDSSGKYIFVP